MAEEQENIVQQPQKKSKALLFVIMGSVLVMLLLVGVIIMLLMGNKEESKENASKNTQEVQANPMANKNQEAKEGSNIQQYLVLGPLYAIDAPFAVNLVSQNGRRYLKASISLELSNEKLLNEVKVKDTAIKDTIIEILSSKSVEEVVTNKGKNKLKDEIKSHLNSFLIDGFIKNVFFTDFIIQ
ncbi:flagellar basal body-associated protein FliL [Helicobacter pylori]|uniref:flagellar basal body-associated protein FliL n=1 Tax=Helicobacter pylori TaxID=210 RepID=UPI00193AC94A|nr:flagellar basal body-associated protein FliL [Helicobacter pylori]MBM2777900.1 flagellar basal body-associated protein FliL [Helicobacter pylori]